MANPSTDFYYFVELLKNKWAGNIQDFSELESIKKSISMKEMSYSANKIVFKNINLGRNSRPKGLPNNSFCELFIDVELSPSDEKIIKSPFLSYSMSIKIASNIRSLGIPDRISKYIIHFDQDDSDDFDFKHPEYHLQFGGKGIIKDENFSYGDFLFLEAPRIMHPPMDIILSIDFIVNNFYTKSQREMLVQDKTYLRAVSKAKELFWKPYALALASHCDNEFERQFDWNMSSDFKAKVC